MRMSAVLMVAAFAASLSACTTAMGTNFSGIPTTDWSTSQKLAQYPADPAFQLPRSQVQSSSPYDSPDFVVPPYLIQP
jgi:hypothetical protein